MLILLVKRQGKKKWGAKALDQSEAFCLSSENVGVSGNQTSAAASAALAVALAGQIRSREAAGLIGCVRRARRCLFSVLPASCRQNETMRDRKTCRRDAGSTFRLRTGWTLIESIAVLAVIAILAAMLAPSVIKRVDRAAWTRETAELNAIGD